MSQVSDDLYSKLKQQVPAFLLLGQNYLRLETNTDPFLSEVLRKYGRVGEEPAHYGQILEGEAHNFADAAIAWMQERCTRLSTPEWIKTVAMFPWSGVYTSAIDVIWPRAFRSEWRELQPILEEKYRPIDPRNRFNLHCTYLFSNVNRIEETERPPLTKFELLERRQIAVTLVRRLPEYITPLGVFVIEGYASEQDWLSPEDLYPIINGLNPNQTHIFSVTKELIENPYISELAKRNKLTLHNESLALYLLRAEEAGFLKLGRRPQEAEYGRRIQLEENVLVVPLNIWNRVSESATILDDTILISLPQLSPDKRYLEFRNFLSESSIKPIWSGYQRNFAITREFERKLRTEVDRKLKSNELQDEPIILHGQTGTGKTIALGALAYGIRKEKKHPVLFIERKSQKPHNSDIDAFCQWAEDQGASTTLIIWDGMVEVDQYYDMLQYLIGRGRKVIVVGSCYRLDTKPQKKSRKKFVEIEAPSNLSQTEIVDFTKFLNGFEPSLGHRLSEQIKQYDDTFLVALYRLLPSTRSSIRLGVTREIGVAEQRIGYEAKKQETITAKSFDNVLAYAFWKKGLISQEQIFSSEIEKVGDEDMNQIQQLIGLIMVPGRFGLRIPFELLLRSLGKEDILNFADLLSQQDIFRWYEDAIGNITVGPRHPLEAQLFVQARFGASKTEVALVKQLLTEVRDDDNSFDNSEVQFAVDLVRSMGPNGLNPTYFASCFRDISETLSKLREERGIQNPRLMLQEATLLRETVVNQSKSGGMSPVDVKKLLDKAENILRQALQILGNDQKSNKQRSAILVEMASLLGTKVRQILDYTQHPKDAIPFFEELKPLLFKARALDTENFYPIDVLSWTTLAFLKSNTLDLKARAEAEADILHAFEMAEAEDFGAVQLERFHSRRLEIANELKNHELSEQAFEKLRSLGSGAGYYLRACAMIKNLSLNTELDSIQYDTCSAAVEYLEENRQAINQDGRSLYLLLRLWWMVKAGKPIFYSERQTVPFTQEDWRYCIEIITQLMANGEIYNTPSLTYLYGLAMFHRGFHEDAISTFRQLERDSDYITGRRRIIRSYLASTLHGQPQKYTGEVAWVAGDGSRGEVYVNELRRRIRFLPRDFNRPEIRQHESLGEFHLAFNFLGPIADPPGYLKPKQKGKT
jgi:hypothetical protein